MVPAAGFEPATNGLQNRCSTPELSRLGPTGQAISERIDRAYRNLIPAATDPSAAPGAPPPPMVSGSSHARDGATVEVLQGSGRGRIRGQLLRLAKAFAQSQITVPHDGFDRGVRIARHRLVLITRRTSSGRMQRL